MPTRGNSQFTDSTGSHPCLQCGKYRHFSKINCTARGVWLEVAAGNSDSRRPHPACSALAICGSATPSAPFASEAMLPFSCAGLGRSRPERRPSSGTSSRLGNNQGAAFCSRQISQLSSLQVLGCLSKSLAQQ